MYAIVITNARFGFGLGVILYYNVPSLPEEIDIQPVSDLRFKRLE